MFKIIWSRLPGNWVLKLIQIVILLVLLGAACHLWIFPALSALLGQRGI